MEVSCRNVALTDYGWDRVMKTKRGVAILVMWSFGEWHVWAWRSCTKLVMLSDAGLPQVRGSRVCEKSVRLLEDEKAGECRYEGVKSVVYGRYVGLDCMNDNMGSCRDRTGETMGTRDGEGCM